MITTIVVAGTIVGVAVPTLVSGNARRTEGSLAAQRAAETPYIASLSGDKEVPGPGAPEGTGAATVSFDTEEVCWDMTYDGIADPAAAHIHEGGADVAGPVVVDFGDPGPDADSGCVAADPDLIAMITANPAGYYVNVHTADYPAGAVRGQLAEGPAPAGSTHFLPTPLRSYDSRVDPGTAFDANETRTISLLSGSTAGGDTEIAVPPGATAAIVTLTATETGGPGFVTAYSAASPRPLTSNLNFTTAGATVAVSTEVAVDANGQIKITTGPAATHMIVDVIGYLY